MTAAGFGNLRVLSLESRRAREMGQLIANHGGQATVIPSTREVPSGPNPEESAFAEMEVVAVIGSAAKKKGLPGAEDERQESLF